MSCKYRRSSGVAVSAGGDEDMTDRLFCGEEGVLKTKSLQIMTDNRMMGGVGGKAVD